MTILPMDYGPLLNELQGRASLARQPLSGVFELTERCNLRCRMCYVSHSAVDTVRRGHELSASAWLALANEAVDNGMVFLLLSGGEVFLRPDFFDIYKPLTRIGLVLTIFTNGTLITDSVARRLAEAPPSKVEVTLYGATSRTYEAVTGGPGSYARCCAGVEALVQHGVPLSLKTTVTRGNIAELEAMRTMARNWGVPFLSSWLLTKRRDRGMSALEDCRVSVAEGVALEQADRATSEEWTEAAIRRSWPTKDLNFFCHAGKSTFVVTANGEMNACVDLCEPAALPLKIGFKEAWAEVQHFVDCSPPLSSECVACDSRDFCSRCPAWSDLETSTLNMPAPYLCAIALARHKAFLSGATHFNEMPGQET